MNQQLLPDGALNEKVMEKAVPSRRKTFRPAAVMAAVFVAALLSVPVMAAAVPWILEQIAPQLTEKLEPVQRSVTNNGITMEVVGASVKGNRVRIGAIKAAERAALKKYDEPQTRPVVCSHRFV